MTNLAHLLERGLGGVAFDANTMARELLAYGEPESAAMLANSNAETLAEISVCAGKLLTSTITIDKAVCLAAVEILEGNPRPLRRSRRVYPKV